MPEQKSSWRFLVQKKAPPPSAWNLFPELPKLNRKKLNKTLAQKWLGLSEAQVETIIEKTADEFAMVNQMLLLETTSLVLVSDKRLPGKNAIVLIHPSTEREVDDMEAVSSSSSSSSGRRGGLKRNTLNAPSSCYHGSAILKKIAGSHLAHNSSSTSKNIGRQSVEQELFTVQILAPRILQKIDGGLEYSAGPGGIGAVKRYILYCVIEMGINNAIQEMVATNLAVKNARGKPAKAAADTAADTAALRPEADKEEDEDEDEEEGGVKVNTKPSSPKFMYSRKEIQKLVQKFSGAKMTGEVKRVVREGIVHLRDEIKEDMEVQNVKVGKKLEVLSKQMKAGDQAVEERLTSCLAESNNNMLTQFREMNLRAEQSMVQNRAGFECLSQTLAKVSGGYVGNIPSTPPPSTPPPIDSPPPSIDSPRPHSPASTTNQKPAKPRRVQILLRLRHLPPSEVIINGDSLIFGSDTLTFNKIFLPDTTQESFFNYFMHAGIIGNFQAKVVRSTIVFCGQSGAGKTFSMLSSEGFVPQLLQYFVKVGQNTTMTATRALGKNENVIVEKILLTDIQSIKTRVDYIREARAVAHTSGNRQSSREHLIVEIETQIHGTRVCLTVIDLAGQETSADRSEGSRAVKKVSNGINKDLIAIKQILSCAASEKAIPVNMRNQDVFTRRLSALFESRETWDQGFLVMAERFDQGYIQTGYGSLRWIGEILAEKGKKRVQWAQ